MSVDASANQDLQNNAVDGAVASMTGFARAAGRSDHGQWNWEVKSVNGRGLEVRFRLPTGFDELEPDLRKTLSRLLKRGSINASLYFRPDEREAGYTLNEVLLEKVFTLTKQVSERFDCDKPRPENILAVRGVIEQNDNGFDEEARSELLAGMKASFEQAVQSLAKDRTGEGGVIAATLKAQLQEISDLTGKARKGAEAAPEAIREKLSLNLKDLMSDEKLPADRLAHEVALLAVKADIREELDRLDAHVEAASVLLATGGAVGRRLDFLSQEFNREANTLCSKAATMDLKQIGLDLKSVIDQMREQVQNIE